MKEKYTWIIECTHTPETIDRIMLPIRKRGICVNKLEYQKKTQESAQCLLEFEIEASELERVRKNMSRIQDVKEVRNA
jgi:acetolactate synthase II small subunit